MPTPTKIELVSSDTTLDDLQELDAKGPKNDKSVKALKLNDIHVADQVFQPRNVRYDLRGSRDHIKVLAGALNAEGKPLGEIEVVAIGPKFFVVDGHHRLSAYKAVNWTKAIPVKVFKGTIKEARDQSLRGNRDDKLRMPLADKSENAWMLIKEGYPKSRVIELTGVSSNQQHMRRILRKLKADGLYNEDMTWSNARSMDRGLEIDFDREAWVNEKALALRDILLKASTATFTRHPEVLAEAIKMISGKLPSALVAQWHEEALAYVQDYQENMELEGDDLGI